MLHHRSQMEWGLLKTFLEGVRLMDGVKVSKDWRCLSPVTWQG